MIGMTFISVYQGFSNKSNNILSVSSALLIMSIFMLNAQSIIAVRHIFMGILSFVLIVSISHFFKNNGMRNLINFISKYSYGAFLFHHIFIIKLISISKNHISSIETSMVLFIASLFIIFLSSYGLTNFSGYFLRKIYS